MKRLSALIVAALVGGTVVSAQAQWVNAAPPANNTQTAFFDNTSWDGTNCNIGFVLTGVAGSTGNPCSNQHPTWLPYTGFTTVNGAFTGANATPTGYDASPDFTFTAGTYYFNDLGIVAGQNPEVWGISTNGTTCNTTAVTLGTNYDATSAFDLCLQLAPQSTDGGTYVFSNAGSQFALFGLEGATLGTGGGQFIVGFEDLSTVNGVPNTATVNDKYSDGDYQDLVLGIYANTGGGPQGMTPEPMTMSLMALGLVGLGGAQLRRRRNNKV